MLGIKNASNISTSCQNIRAELMVREMKERRKLKQALKDHKGDKPIIKIRWFYLHFEITN